MAVLLLVTSSSHGFACTPSFIRTPETSANVVEGKVVARYGRLYGVPVPLVAAYIGSIFGDVGEAVAVVFIDKTIKGHSARIITVSDRLFGGSGMCRGDVPDLDQRVLLFGGERLLSGIFKSFFGPSGFYQGTFEEYGKRMSQRSSF